MLEAGDLGSSSFPVHLPQARPKQPVQLPERFCFGGEDDPPLSGCW